MIRSEDYVYFTMWSPLRANVILGPYGPGVLELYGTDQNCWLGDYHPISANGLTGFVVIYAVVTR